MWRSEKRSSVGIMTIFDCDNYGAELQAYALPQALRERGIRVPEQIQIVGTDDGPLCGYTQPMLSSVSGQDAARSRLGIQTLQRLIAGESVGHTRVTPQFIARGTTRTQSPETPDIRS